MKHAAQAVKQAAGQRLFLIIVIPVPGVEDHPAELNLKSPPPGRQLSVRHSVQGKNVYENSAVISRLPVLLVEAGGPAVPNLGVAPQIIVLRVDRLKLQSFLQLPQGHLHKPVVILPEHGQVNIVIPGNITSVPHSADEGSAVRKVPQAVFSADPLHLVHHGQLHRPHSLHLFCYEIAAPLFLTKKIPVFHG